jgi:preprotein translocase subunit YajC
VEQFLGPLLLALPLLLLWMVISRARRQQRLLAAAQASIRPGLWAMTTSGLHGRVVSAGDGEPTVVLEVAPGVHTRWARLAIAEVFDEDPARTTTSGAVVDLTNDNDPPGLTKADDSGSTDDRTHN